MEPCRYDMACWRPLCPFRHSGASRAAKWVAVWTLLAEQEGQEENLEAIKVIPKDISEHIVEKVIVEQIVDVPPPPLMEETAKEGQIIPQELVQNRTAEQKVDIPMPPLMEETAKEGQIIPQKLVQNRTAEQIVDIPVPPLKEEIAESRQTIPQELVQNRNEPVPQFPEEIVEVIKLFPAERISERTIEHVVDASAPQILEEDVEVVKDVVPQDRVSEQIVDATVPHSVDVPVPPFQEGIEELFKLSSAERISKRTVEQIVDWPVPQIEEQIAEVAKTTPRRHGCRHACCDAPTGPSGSGCAGDGGSPAVAVHRQSYGRAVDQPGDQARLDSTEHLRRHSCRHACCDEPTGPLQITVPVSFQEEIIKVVNPFPAERISERTCDQLVDMPVPQIQEQIVEAAERIPQERISEHTVEQFAGVPVPQIHKQIMEVANTIPQERISERIVEHARDVPVPQLREQNVEVVTKTAPGSKFQREFLNRSSTTPLHINQATKHVVISQTH